MYLVIHGNGNNSWVASFQYEFCSCLTFISRWSLHSCHSKSRCKNVYFLRVDFWFLWLDWNKQHVHYNLHVCFFVHINILYFVEYISWTSVFIFWFLLKYETSDSNCFWSSFGDEHEITKHTKYNIFDSLHVSLLVYPIAPCTLQNGVHTIINGKYGFEKYSCWTYRTPSQTWF